MNKNVSIVDESVPGIPMRNVKPGIPMRAIRLLACVLPALCLISCAAAKFPVVKPSPRMPHAQFERMRAEEYFLQGRDYDHRGLSQMAERLYEMALEFDPHSVVLRELLAGKYIENGKYTQALLTIKGKKEIGDLTLDQKRLLATVYVKMGQFQNAADAIQTIQVKTPQEIYTLGLLFEAAGKTQLAIEYYSRYLDTDTSAGEIAGKMIDLLVKQKMYRQADSLLARLEKKYGQSARMLNLSGIVSLAKGDSAQALDAFKMAVIADSSYEDAMRNAAQLYIEKKEFRNAIPLYEKLITIPQWGSVYGKTLAILYYYSQRYKDAELLLRKLLASDMDDLELHYNLGLAAMGQDSANALARLEFEKVVALDSTYADAWRQLCILGVKEKDLDRALADAKRYARAVPGNPDAWRTHGYVYSARKEYGSAVPVLRKALALDSMDTFSLFELGSAFERSKQPDSAASVFKKLLARRPGDAVTANYLGYMWAERGVHLDSAKLLIQSALKKDPDNGAYLDSYAWVLYQTGRNDSALVYIKKAADKIKDDAVVFIHLGDILMRNGDAAGALVAYEKALGLNPEDKVALEKKIAELKKR